MQLFVVWLVIGLALIGLEMLSGTLYLLFLGLSALLGALAAYAGLGFAWQVAAFAAPAALSCFWAVPMTRRRKSARQDALDVGQMAQFERWTSEPARLARVRYRGSHWDAEVLNDAAVADGEWLHIVAVEGSRLKVIGGNGTAPAAHAPSAGFSRRS